MRYTLLIVLIFICCFTNNNFLFGQQIKQKKIKPVYSGKLQVGYFIDKVIPKGAGSFTYLNLGRRKITGEKIVELGVETFHYKIVQDKEVINDFFTKGTTQTGFGLSYYYYLMAKKWNFGKLSLQTGPQFSFGYYHNNNQPLNRNNFAKTFNDFKIGAAARIELNYKIDGRYSIIMGSQYTITQFGLRRINSNNPALDKRSQVEDFLQFDFLVDHYTAYLGIIRQFGRVKIDRVKLKEKRAKTKQKKQEKIDKELIKKQKKKEKKKAKTKKKNKKK